MTSIRNIALAVPRRGDDVLVFRGHDRTRDQTFYRPLGGGIEFGETAAQALHREMREELAVELTGVRLLGVLENLFQAYDRAGHEIVFVFACDLADRSLYERDHVGEILDDAGTPVLWRPLSGFGDITPLYPAGLADLLAK
ncbi:NUDIX hydrolase [Catellatospora sichuanensis]|uniref:NUDIX hydrolase n=1 Tax=Catellatospora sichuanensis TaxID=1969805 RepID=UPI00118386B6|nr:NUDIX domain-containing protein [Catellatospora sichuanensis]